MRHEGDLSRDCEFQRYVDGDIHESAEKYWQSRIEALTAERDAAYLAGVKAGLKAAGEMAKDTQPIICAVCGLSRALPHHNHGFVPATLVDVASNIRALDPVAIARAAQKEGGE
jgi:hypothetical protein